MLMAIVMTLLFIMSGLVNQFNAEPGLATHQVAGHQKWIVVRANSRVKLKPLTLAQFKESAVPRND